MKMFSLYFAAFLLGLASSASIRSALWEIPCPADKLSCENGTDIGMVGFEFPEQTHLQRAKQGTYKDLVCYPLNFCSMRWLKDGIPFPWAWSTDMGVTQGICNSTLMFRRVGLDAAGVYTCEVKGANGTTISRNITLRVKAAPPPPPPIVVAGDLCANHTAALRSNVTFRCEIYVGLDSVGFSYTYWLMEASSGEWEYPDDIAPNDTVIQQSSKNDTPRPGYMITELQIYNISPEVYTRYKLFVSSSGRNSVTSFNLQQSSSDNSNEINGDSPISYESSEVGWWKTFGVTVLCILIVIIAIVTVVVVIFYKRIQILSDMKTKYEYHIPEISSI